MSNPSVHDLSRISWRNRIGWSLWDFCIFLFSNATCIPMGHAGIVPGIDFRLSTNWMIMIPWISLSILVAAVLVSNRKYYFGVAVLGIAGLCVRPCIALIATGIYAGLDDTLLMAALFAPFAACLNWRLILLYRVASCSEDM
jgi:hypothetical protein